MTDQPCPLCCIRELFARTVLVELWRDGKKTGLVRVCQQCGRKVKKAGRKAFILAGERAEVRWRNEQGKQVQAYLGKKEKNDEAAKPRPCGGDVRRT